MKILSKIENSGYKLSIALGYFDGLHKGHNKVIMNALDCKNYVPAVFTFLEHPHKDLNKASPPMLMTNRQKLKKLENMGVGVVYMPKFSEIMDIEAEEFIEKILIEKLSVRKITCGYNFKFGKMGKGDCTLISRICDKNNIEFLMQNEILCDGVPVSSTAIRNYIENGEIDKANKMLSDNFSYDFTVVHGRHLGSLLGIPTINQIFPENFIKPKYGVYISKTYIDDRSYMSITNIGVKPTVGSDFCVSETHLIGYDGDLYGQRVKVELIAFKRPEKKFTGIDELKRAIESDIQDACKFY